MNYFTYELIKAEWKKNGIAGGGREGAPCTFSYFVIIFLCDQAKYI